jgi:hypothetical protein
VAEEIVAEEIESKRSTQIVAEKTAAQNAER